MIRILCAAVVIGLLFAAPVAAQSEDAAAPGDVIRTPSPPGPDGLGDVVYGPVDVEGPSGDVRCLGVDYYETAGPATGKYFVSGAAGGAGLQQIYQFNAGTGFFEAQYNQVATSSPFWGNRDLAGGPAGDIFGGNEGNELHQYNWNGATLSYVGVYVDASATIGTIRALAQDPNTGDFWTADFSGAVYQFAITGPGTLGVITSWPNPGQALYGFAWDDKQTASAADDTIWGWSQDGGNPACTTDGVLAREYNPFTMLPTGQEFFGTQIGGCGSTNIAGGADIYNDPRNPSAGFNSLVGEHQAAPDSITVYDLNPAGNPKLRPPFPGEPRMDNVIVADSVTPGAGCRFVAGLSAGASPVGAPCAGDMWDISVLVTLGEGTANASGLAAKGFYAPGKAANKTAKFQCVDLSNCAKSSVLDYTFPP